MPLEEINGRIVELCEEWRSLQPLSPEDDERLWKKIRLEWNYHSNRIEGNTLTYSETELLFLHGRCAGGHPIRHYEEMKAHDLGIEKARELAADENRPLTEADIRDLNGIILKEPFWTEAQTPDGRPTRKKIVPGRYKTQPNHVITSSGELFRFASPEEVAPKMGELVKWFGKNIESPPGQTASFLAELHHRFIVIHPFDDGNGRIARLWMNYALMRLGFPPMVIRAEEREAYFSALQKADARDTDALAVYLGRVLVFWLETGIRAAKGEDISEPTDIDKEVDIFIRRRKSEREDEELMSRDAVREICETSWMPLFETFERRFKQFDELFFSRESHTEPGFSEDWRKDLGNYAEEWKPDSIGLSFSVFYNKYKGTKPVGMYVELFIGNLGREFEYAIIVESDWEDRVSHRMKTERKYPGVWTESEIRKFVAEGKTLFFETLKKATAEDDVPE